MARRRQPYRWHWGCTDPSDDGVFDARNHWAEYCEAEKLTTLHPKLRRRELHDHLWKSLGHELVHAIYKDSGSTSANERRANRLEAVAGNVLHDFFLRFYKAGLPRCTGDHCHAARKKR